MFEMAVQEKRTGVLWSAKTPWTLMQRSLPGELYR